MRVLVAIGALFCFIGVVSGALGSHALKAALAATQGIDHFNLAKEYMFYHGLGLIAAGLLVERFPRSGFAPVGTLFIFGSILFQGSLFVSSLSGMKSVTVVAPFGGVLLMLAWLGIAVAVWRTAATRRI